MADWEEPCVEVTVYIKLELPAGKPDPRAGRVLGAVGEWASRPRFLSAFAPSSGASGLQVGGRPRGGKDLRWPKVRTPGLEDSGLAGTPRGTAQRGWGHQFTGSSVLSPGATPLRESAFTSRAKHPSPCPALGLGETYRLDPPPPTPCCALPREQGVARLLHAPNTQAHGPRLFPQEESSPGSTKRGPEEPRGRLRLWGVEATSSHSAFYL